MNEWVWFCGVLLPSGYKDLEYPVTFYQSIKPFIHVDHYFDKFVDRPILEEYTRLNIGKIKSVWKDDEGRVLIGGYIKSSVKYDGISIFYTLTREREGEPYIYMDFGCSIVKEPLYKGCRILQKHGESLPFLSKIFYF